MIGLLLVVGTEMESSSIQQYISENDTTLFHEISPLKEGDEAGFKTFSHDFSLFYEIFDRLTVIKEISCTHFSPIHPTTQFALLNGFVPKQKQWATVKMDQWTLSQVLLDSAKEIGFVQNDEKIDSLQSEDIIILTQKYTGIAEFLLDLVRYITKNSILTFSEVHQNEKNIILSTIGGSDYPKTFVIEKKMLYRLFTHYKEKRSFTSKPRIITPISEINLSDRVKNIFKGKPSLSGTNLDSII